MQLGNFKSKQQTGAGAIAFLITVILVLFLLYLFGKDALPSNPNDLRALIHVAESNEAATKLIRDRLTESPTPTVGELSVLKHQVNNILLAALSEQVVGKQQAVIGDSIRDIPWVKFVFMGINALFLFWLLLWFLKKFVLDAN
jgi:hypothetical protein